MSLILLISQGNKNRIVLCVLLLYKCRGNYNIHLHDEQDWIALLIFASLLIILLIILSYLLYITTVNTSETAICHDPLTAIRNEEIFLPDCLVIIRKSWTMPPRLYMDGGKPRKWRQWRSLYSKNEICLMQIFSRCSHRYR